MVYRNGQCQHCGRGRPGRLWDAVALQRAAEQGMALYTCPLPEFEASYLAAAKLGLPLPQA